MADICHLKPYGVDSPDLKSRLWDLLCGIILIDIGYIICVQFLFQYKKVVEL